MIHVTVPMLLLYIGCTVLLSLFLWATRRMTMARTSDAALLLALVLPLVFVCEAVFLGSSAQASSMDRFGHVMCVLLICPLMAVFAGLLGGGLRKIKSGCALVFGMVQVVFGPIIIALLFEVSSNTRSVRSGQNLEQIRALLTVYAEDYHCYPSMQPTNILPRINAGVRDLYPLYSTASDKSRILALLRPSDMDLAPLSSNPTPDEFDTNHIGYVYDSTVLPDQPDNPPLMADRYALDIMFLRNKKPPCRHGNVLMANGTIINPAIHKDVLILDGSQAIKDLNKLKDDVSKLK
jgi:hypothetical protein